MKYVLTIPFDERDNFPNVFYSSKDKVYIHENKALPESLKAYRCKMFSLEWHVENKINNITPSFSYKKIWEPKKHQSFASIAMKTAYKEKSPGFLLADDTGLGKTISALDFALNEKGFKKILIVSPLSVLAHWRETLFNLGADSSKEILLINYDKLAKLFQINDDKKLSSSRTKGKQKRIAREVPAPVYDLIIWDESHKCKNSDSAKGQLAEKLNAKAKFSLWMSATAGQNVLELAYLRSIIAKRSGFKITALKSYVQWCKSYDAKTNQLNIEINNYLFNGKNPYALRRRPEDIQGWREMERNLYPVMLDEQSMVDYQKSWEEFKAELIEERKSKTKKEKQSNFLVKSIRFRQKSSWLRIVPTFELILDHLSSGKQVAVSVAFKETQMKLKELLEKKKITASIINGDMSSDQKENDRLLFQKGEKKVIIFTVEEGISLHQGQHNDVERVLLIHDIRWSAIQMAQIEGRCHRDGYFSPCYWLYAEDTKDKDIGNALIKKIINMKSLMGDDTDILKEIEEIFIS